MATLLVTYLLLTITQQGKSYRLVFQLVSNEEAGLVRVSRLPKSTASIWLH